ncbi:MAG: hypothetical protein AMXMBFR56_81450 [Polyangiaceae bacterium]
MFPNLNGPQDSPGPAGVAQAAQGCPFASQKPELFVAQGPEQAARVHSVSHCGVSEDFQSQAAPFDCPATGSHDPCAVQMSVSLPQGASEQTASVPHDWFCVQGSPMAPSLTHL